MALSSRELRSPKFQQYDYGGGGQMPPPGGFGYDMTPMRDGPDWEKPELGVFSRWWSTVVGVFSKPTETFQSMRLEGGIGAPLIFGVIGATIGSVIATLYQMVFEVIGLSFNMAGGASQEDVAAGAFGTGFGLIIGICLAPVLAAVSIFISSGMIHLVLMMLGGAERGYEATLRTLSYVSGSINLLQIIPICGGCVALVWYIIAMPNALTHTHDISLGKAYAAVLLPIVFCCTLIVGGITVFVAFVGIAATGF